MIRCFFTPWIWDTDPESGIKFLPMQDELTFRIFRLAPEAMRNKEKVIFIFHHYCYVIRS
jgi:hypothetical protein